MYTEKDNLAATTLRMLAIDAVQEANSGHPGLPLGAADIAIVLWTRFLKHDPHDPHWPDRDRFVLSAGHGSALLYSLLHLSGYPLSMAEVKRFRQWGSVTPGHPEYDLDLGIETTTGPLGQGFSNAVGLALAERILASKFNQPGFEIVDHYTYVLASDGDLMEGVSHESASLAGHLGLSRLIVLYDDNHISIDGPTDLSYSDDVPGRFAAYGWHVQKVDGHDMAAIDAALDSAKSETSRPSLIACRTHIGLGSPRQDTAKVHGSPLGEEDLKKTKVQFGWDPEAKFFVPDEVRAYFSDVGNSGARVHQEWLDLLAGYRTSHPDLAAEWDRYVQGELTPGWEDYLPDFSGEKPLATRVASGRTLDAVAPHLPTLIGGSADLTPSNNTKYKDVEEISPGQFSGSYIHFGVREHGMGSIMNGLALHGLRPYGGTFLIFSDYLRPTIRLAGQMGLPVVYVFTHDSIGLGEDGPTHQPIEHITSLRAIPNLLVLRPADGNETSAAWKLALQRDDGPTALILTRQGLPQLIPVENGAAQGAYVLIPPADGNADVVQPLEYRETVLPPGVPRLSIEAGVTFAWGHYLGGPRDKAIGVDRYGASAPYKTIFESYGLTVDAVVASVKQLLA
jgi:transketolase